MAWKADIIQDSRAPCGARLTTFVLSYPRFIHSEFMTHREFSRNAASSRAIPIEKMIAQVNDDPAMPVWWGAKQKGMQAPEQLPYSSIDHARSDWLDARDYSVSVVEGLADLGLHKQIANRLLEPWMWMTTICSSTSYTNFFKLRCHPDAQPEMRHLAEMMREAYESKQPYEVEEGGWHLPFITYGEDNDLSAEDAAKVSVARCARVSYLTHDGRRDIDADLSLYKRLESSGHWSPFEHVAQALPIRVRYGNFIGWAQYRKRFPNEYVSEGHVFGDIGNDNIDGLHPDGPDSPRPNPAASASENPGVGETPGGRDANLERESVQWRATRWLD